MCALFSLVELLVTRIDDMAPIHPYLHPTSIHPSIYRKEAKGKKIGNPIRSANPKSDPIGPLLPSHSSLVPISPPPPLPPPDPSSPPATAPLPRILRAPTPPLPLGRIEEGPRRRHAPPSPRPWKGREGPLPRMYWEQPFPCEKKVRSRQHAPLPAVA